MVVGSSCDAVDVTMADNAGTCTETVSNAATDATVVVVPRVVLPSVGSPATGSQAPVLMGFPSCSTTVGSEFK